MAILTQGTLVDYDMLEAKPDASFLLVVWEAPSTNESRPSEGDVLGSAARLGLCALDAGTGRFLLGQVKKSHPFLFLWIFKKLAYFGDLLKSIPYFSE